MFCCVSDFAFQVCVSFKHFWPPALAGRAPIAIILQALRRLGGVVLFAVCARRQAGVSRSGACV